MQSLQDALSHSGQLVPVTLALNSVCSRTVQTSLVLAMWSDGQYFGAARATQLSENPADSGFSRFELQCSRSGSSIFVKSGKVCARGARGDVFDGFNAECRDELRTGVPLRGVMSAWPVETLRTHFVDQRFLLKWLRYRPEHDVKLLIKRWKLCVVVR